MPGCGDLVRLRIDLGLAYHKTVAMGVRGHQVRGDLRALLDETSDLHRLTTRVSTARATPKDQAAVGRTLRLLPQLKAKLTGHRSALLNELEARLDDDRLVLNEGQFFDKWGRRMKIEDVTQ